MGTTIAEIRSMLSQADAEELEAIERSLGADSRKGVRAEIEKARRRIEAREAERERLAAMISFDRSQIEGANGMVVGLDEVGRGAVAGPLAVGAVVLPDGCTIENLNDSKQLSASQREKVAAEIEERALAWSVYYVEPADIDAEGMSASLRKAFAGALAEVEAAGIEVGVVLVDGNPLGLDSREKNVVKGDSKSASIAAASVVAKVQRDALMRRLSSTFPQYEFSENKGYGSQRHVDAIKEFGLSPVHRRSFCRSFLQESLF